jgi:hypothetical protein
MKRPYPTISSVHQVKSAQTFIKAMLLLAKESENLIAEIMPEQYKRQKELLIKCLTNGSSETFSLRQSATTTSAHRFTETRKHQEHG